MQTLPGLSVIKLQNNSVSKTLGNFIYIEENVNIIPGDFKNKHVISLLQNITIRQHQIQANERDSLDHKSSNNIIHQISFIKEFSDINYVLKEVTCRKNIF